MASYREGTMGIEWRSLSGYLFHFCEGQLLLVVTALLLGPHASPILSRILEILHTQFRRLIMSEGALRQDRRRHWPKLEELNDFKGDPQEHAKDCSA
jgi:hypothetical protein